MLACGSCAMNIKALPDDEESNGDLELPAEVERIGGSVPVNQRIQ